MADFELKFEGSLGFEGNRGSHIDRTNRVWAFGFGHKIKNGWDSDKIEEINEIYQIMRNAYSLTRGLLVVIPRNGGGEIGINNFNLNLFETKGNLRPTSFSIHIYKTEGGQFPVHREIEFSGVSRPGKPQETVFQPFWVNGVPIGFGSNDPSFEIHHFTYSEYKIY